MADFNPSDLDREQRGSSNPNQTPNEPRDTRSTETGADSGSPDSQRPNKNREGLDSEREGVDSERGVGSSESEDRGNIEGDDNLNRR